MQKLHGDTCVSESCTLLKLQNNKLNNTQVNLWSFFQDYLLDLRIISTVWVTLCQKDK